MARTSFGLWWIAATFLVKATAIINRIFKGVIGRKFSIGRMTDNQIKELQINNENVRFLLGQKISHFNTVSHVCMSWWVSSIVFCGSILAAVWFNRSDLMQSGIFPILGFVVAFFFLSFIWFGTVINRYLTRLDKDISFLIKKLKPNVSKLNPDCAFGAETHSIKWGIRIGISTFILILLAWFFLVTTLHLGFWKSLQEIENILQSISTEIPLELQN